MRKPATAFILVAVFITLAACWLLKPRPPYTRSVHNVLAAETIRILDSGGRFVLLSLDPKPITVSGSNVAPGGAFHNYPVLGRTETLDHKERAELLNAL